MSWLADFLEDAWYSFLDLPGWLFPIAAFWFAVLMTAAFFVLPVAAITWLWPWLLR